MAGTINFCPRRMVAFGRMLLAAAISAIETPCFFAIVHKLSPLATVYVEAGVTSPTGCDSSVEAAGVPGRVGEKRISGVALAFGSKDEGTELAPESSPAITTGETLSDPARDTGVFEASSVEESVSEGEGAGLFGELQPGFAKISTSANTWMPTTTLKILRIFIAGVLLV